MVAGDEADEQQKRKDMHMKTTQIKSLTRPGQPRWIGGNGDWIFTDTNPNLGFAAVSVKIIRDTQGLWHVSHNMYSGKIATSESFKSRAAASAWVVCEHSRIGGIAAKYMGVAEHCVRANHAARYTK